MKRIFLILAILVVGTIAVAGQQKAFSEVERVIKAERNFAGSKEAISKAFNAERIRLADGFESALWQFLGKDEDRFYWVPWFLTEKVYLHGSEPREDLALQITAKHLELISNKKDAKSRGQWVTIARRLAVSAKLKGDTEKAIKFRDEAERVLANEKSSSEIRSHLGARSLYHICVYENINGSIDACDPNPPVGTRVVSTGWMNTRATNFKNPAYPPGVRIHTAAKVDVRINVDVSGNVESAEIMRGPKELHEVSLDTAKQLKFPPMTLMGQPARMSGWVSFVFRPDQ